MIVRELPAAEWDRLKTTANDRFVPPLPEESVRILVVEDGERIVASCAVCRVPLLENFWVDPDLRGNPGTTRGLIRKLKETALEWGPWALVNTGTDKMNEYVKRAGGHKLGGVDTFILPLGG